MKTTRFRPWTLPLVFLSVCTLAFGLLIPWLGFYQDDWYQVWFRRAFGVGVFPEYYSGERPFIAGIYMLTMPLIGNFPLNWQIFALICRWISVLAVFWSLRLVWPKHIRQVVWIALLFSVFPGFRQQFASVIYSHYFLQLAVQMASIGMMVLAVRHPKRVWLYTSLALLTQFLAVFTSEYFFGLELLRPVFLWLVLSEDHSISRRTLAKKFLLIWLPYLIIILLFLIWRIFVFKFPTYQPLIYQNVRTGFLGLSVALVQTILQDVFEMGVLAWGLTLTIFQWIATRQPMAIAAVLLATACALGLGYYLSRLQIPEPSDTHSPEDGLSFPFQLILIGCLGLFAAGLPFWFVGLPVGTDIERGSRFGISFMLASSFLMAGLIDLLLRKTWIKNVAVAILVGLCIGFHFTDANYYRQVHRSQAAFFQQLAWRAPGLRPGTLILTNQMKEPLLNGDNSLTAALNWIYEPSPPYSLEYMLFYLPSRIMSGNLTGLKTGLPVIKYFRTTQFVGSTSQALVVYYPYPHCLRVLDPEVDLNLPRPLDMPRELQEAIPISNLDQIMPVANPAAQLDERLFKYKLDDSSWCGFYERASLAQQQKDWQKVARLGDEAIRNGQKIDNTWELLPFIEGYARSGQLEKARKITLDAFQSKPEGRAMTLSILCSTWMRIGDDSSQENPVASFAKDVRDDLGCK